MKFNSESIFHSKVSSPEGVDSTLPTEYEFVANLLSQQDEVLAGLDDLNDRVLAAIEELTVLRQAEANDLEVVQSDPSEAKVASDAKEDSKAEFETQIPIKRAA